MKKNGRDQRWRIGAGGRQVWVISVTQKDAIPGFCLSIEDFCQQLSEIVSVDFVSTGGTATRLREAGIKRVFDMQEVVGGEELFGDLVKSLSREIAAGLLAPKSGRKLLKALGIPYITGVCVDFYQLWKKFNVPGATRLSVIQDTDVGGPTMTHEAAKGGRIIICRPQDRQPELDWIRAGKPDEENHIQSLRARAEFEATRYLGTSANIQGDGKFLVIAAELVKVLRYGENPYQTPAYLYATDLDDPDPLATHRFLTVDGKEASLINEKDLHRLLAYLSRIAAAWEVNFGVKVYIAVAVKHGNACGAAVALDPVVALREMVSGDLRAIFGGVVMTNFPIGKEGADILRRYMMGGEKKRNLDVVIAPSFTGEAIDLLARKEDRCRMAPNEELLDLGVDTLDMSPLISQVRGGLLVQPSYNTYMFELNDPNISKIGEISVIGKQDMVLAWCIGSLSNSNTITLVDNLTLIGNGIGQQDRVGAAELAKLRADWAGHPILGATGYSDSFFPFPDGPQVLIDAGVQAIFATSGSQNDDQTIALCRERGVALYMVSDKLGRGFAWH